MQRLKTIVSHFPVSRSLRIACLTAAVGGLAFVSFGFADENGDAAQPKAATPSTSQPAATPDQAKPTPTDSAGDMDHVRHHGALGVLLSKSGETVVVVGVIPNSPAARAGMRLGDEILYVGDDRIHSIHELIAAISASKPGTGVEVLIRRNGKRRVVEANLAERDSTFKNEDAAQSQAMTPGAGAPAVRAQGPAVSPPGMPPRPSREQQLSQRIRMLERQLYLMQRELNDLKYAHTAPLAPQSYDSGQWWEQQHHGQADDDPALFQ